MWYVYILECRNGQLYTVMTDDVHRRTHEHISGKGGRFTKIYGVKNLLYQEEFQDRNDARQRESQLKKWTRRKKMALAEGNRELLKKL